MCFITMWMYLTLLNCWYILKISQDGNFLVFFHNKKFSLLLKKNFITNHQFFLIEKNKMKCFRHWLIFEGGKCKSFGAWTSSLQFLIYKIKESYCSSKAPSSSEMPWFNISHQYLSHSWVFAKAADAFQGKLLCAQLSLAVSHQDLSSPEFRFQASKVEDQPCICAIINSKTFS